MTFIACYDTGKKTTEYPQNKQHRLFGVLLQRYTASPPASAATAAPEAPAPRDQ